MISYKSCVMNGKCLEHNKRTKEFEKLEKKYLTNSTRCAKISKFAANENFKTNGLYLVN